MEKDIMARGVNKVILIGNLGKDPEVRFLPSGNPVANVTIATSDSWTDRQSGQRQERTEWHRIVFFNKLAEIVQQYVKKGSRIYIEGKLQTRKWTDQQGVDHYSTEIVANELQMLDSRQQNGDVQGQNQTNQQPQQNYQQQPQQNTQQGGYQNQPQSAQQNQPTQQPQQNQPQQNPNQNYGAPNPGSFDDFDDEIPF